jgi:hypothetical protein
MISHPAATKFDNAFTMFYGVQADRTVVKPVFGDVVGKRMGVELQR